MAKYMKKFSIILGTSLALTTSSLPSSAAIPATVNPISSPSLAPMLEKVTPEVVNINVQKEIPYPEALSENLPMPKENNSSIEGYAVGSGVIFDGEKGLIVTNAHVVKDQKIIVVTLKDARRYRANLVAKDEGFDLAVLHIKAPGLNSINFGNSDQLKVGDFVAAIGSPFGLTQTVTSGMISALNRNEPQMEGFQSFIQTDAPINPGNSGGALVDMQGNLIGINTGIFSTSGGSNGVGFAIPSNMVHAVVTQLLEHGKVTRGMLGVLAQNISPEIAESLKITDKEGALVTDTIPGSPARDAKILPEDIIRKIDSTIIKSSEQLRSTLGLMRPGTKIQISIERSHKPITLRATMGNPNKIAQPQIPFLGGLRLEDFSQLQPDGTYLKGALVITVNDSSDAALAGLGMGDVILTANSQLINSVQQLQDIANQKPEQLLLKIARNNGKLYVVISGDN